MSYVGGKTRIGVGLDTEFKGRADITHTFSDTPNSATSGQAWVGVNPTAKKAKKAGETDEEVLTGAGVKLNHNWVSTDGSGQAQRVNKIFGAYDQNELKDKKVSVGYGQENEDMFWSGHISKGISDKRVSGTTADGQDIYEKAYDYGVGGRVGSFIDEQLMRVQGGLDYEWGKEKAEGEKTASQLTVTGGLEKFFFDSPHSVGANVEVVKEQGGYVNDKHDADVRGNLSYRYDFGGESIFQADQKYRRVRVEIPGKTIVTKKAPKVERKLVKHTMELESDTFFEVGKYNLTPEAQQRLSSVMGRIRDSGHEGNIRITGNTCDKGTTEHNQTLSENRANAVRNFMINNGFAEQELLARGLGETSPKYPNAPATAHKNRRVDIEYVTYETKYQDQTVNQGEEVRTQTEPQVVWRKELIQSAPTWVGQALHNNIQYKQTIDTYRTLGAAQDGGTTPANDLPVATGDTVETLADSKVIIDVLANDSDANDDTLSITTFDETSEKGGSISLVDGKLSYIPAAGFTGTDTFKYTISDGRGGTASATVTVTVSANGTGDNQAPIAATDYVTTDVDAKVVINVLANDTDADNDTLTITSFTETSLKGGTVSLVDGKLSYVPPAGFTGVDTVKYLISDGNGGTATGSVMITVGTATGGTLKPDDDSYKVTAADIDSNGEVNLDILSGDEYASFVAIRITRAPSYGTITTLGADNTISSQNIVMYKPDATAIGSGNTDTFTYVLVDNDGQVSDPATVSITFSSASTGGGFDAIDDGADGKDALYNFTTEDFASNTIKSRTLTVLDNDAGTDLKIVSVTQPTYGTAKISDNGQSIVYTPRHGYCKSHTFTYTVRDASGNEETATVYINIE
jgi:outer membrane protein OmpA-like peptidoglycan-associated protein